MTELPFQKRIWQIMMYRTSVCRQQNEAIALPNFLASGAMITPNAWWGIHMGLHMPYAIPTLILLVPASAPNILAVTPVQATNNVDGVAMGNFVYLVTPMTQVYVTEITFIIKTLTKSIPVHQVLCFRMITRYQKRRKRWNKKNQCMRNSSRKTRCTTSKWQLSKPSWIL